MFFTCWADFLIKISKIKRLSREEEKKYALLMKEGDKEAREIIIRSYLPVIASFVKRIENPPQSLELIYRHICFLEESVDKFDFLQDNYTFVKYLSDNRQKVWSRYITDKSI